MLEESKLNWSSVRPPIDDVIGKCILVEYMGANGIDTMSTPKLIPGLFSTVFDKSFIRYAIISTEEQPLELDGVLPEVVELNGELFSCHVFVKEYKLSVYGSARAEAIANWNAFVRRFQ
jgi:hypothetical protein